MRGSVMTLAATMLPSPLSPLSPSSVTPPPRMPQQRAAKANREFGNSEAEAEAKEEEEQEEEEEEEEEDGDEEEEEEDEEEEQEEEEKEEEEEQEQEQEEEEDLGIITNPEAPQYKPRCRRKSEESKRPPDRDINIRMIASKADELTNERQKTLPHIHAVALAKYVPNE